MYIVDLLDDDRNFNIYYVWFEIFERIFFISWIFGWLFCWRGINEFYYFFEMGY